LAFFWEAEEGAMSGNGSSLGDVEFHPLAEIFPLIEGPNFDGLVASIRDDGQLEPIYLYEGKILDGRNRYRACLAVGVEPKFRVFEGKDPLSHVVNLNLHRRHLNESQRAMVAARLANMQHGGDRRSEQAANLPLVPQPEAAKRLSVGERSVRSARTVQDHAIPGLVAAVDSGQVPVSRAASLARETPEKQKAICEKLAEGLSLKKAIQAVTKAAQEAVPGDLPHISERYQLLAVDIRNLDIDPETIDVIVCDPPYPKDYLDTFKWLAEKAAVWLKPGGSLVVMSGQSWLPEVMARLADSPLRYHWTFAYLTPGGQAVQMFDRKVNTFWKPVFWFVKGAYEGQWVGDVATSKVNDNDKRFHGWGQSESGMEDLIGRVSMPGQVILDPFCGGGTTGVAAVSMNRFFVGADVDAKAIETTARRLKEVCDAAILE
jgi:16S rRNA G966 N2-methylase RsmD